MPERARFAYAQARLHAHHGRRPTAAAWRMLDASKSLGHYLDSARQTGLAPWITHLSAASDIHGIELTLRRDWRAYVARLASWVPDDWRDAVLWTAVLADLPLDTHAARGLELPSWASSRANDNAATASVDDNAWAGGPEPLSAWVEHFRALWPSAARTDLGDLESLMDRIRDNLGPKGGSDGEGAREQLRTLLEKTFRRHAQHPAAVFAFIALAALDVEKLRGDLAKRALFPERMEA